MVRETNCCLFYVYSRAEYSDRGIGALTLFDNLLLMRYWGKVPGREYDTPPSKYEVL